MSTKVLFIGNGKMGKELLFLCSTYQLEPAFMLVKKKPETPISIPWGLSLDEVPLATIDLAIDFSSAENIVQRSVALFEKKIPLIQGTTGWDDTRDLVLKHAEELKSPLVWSYNFSIGCSLFKQIVSFAGTLLKGFPEFDIALMEAHHRKKKDAPSGTLLSLRDKLTESLQERTAGCSMKSQLLDPREIDLASLRVGHVPGYHAVWIDGPFENIQLTHSVRSRSVFADGALLAANLLLKKPGVWHFDELLSSSLGSFA